MREVDRLEVIREVAGKRLRQGEAGERMRLSVRQVKRLLRRYREFGAVGLISGHRGRLHHAAAAHVDTRQAVSPSDPTPNRSCSRRQPPLMTSGHSPCGPSSARPGRGKLWNEFIARYHYLGYKTVVGVQIRYAVHDRHRWPIAMLRFSTAAWKLASRDHFIGWSPQLRERKLPLVVD